jgi:fructose-specific PTS system IIB-like component
MAKKIIGLCACTMGLAHTFMAAQGLEDAAKELGYEIKVETQGADGLQNELTPQEIADADIIIHAVAITPQNNERFDDYDVYEIELQDAIKNAKATIQEIEALIAEEG